jgi:uncharacterized protein with PIN domain
MREPCPSRRFAADRTLGRLARWLRLLGADVLRDPSLDAAQMLRRARAEERTLLTRDKRLRTAHDAFYVASNNFRAQLREVMARFHLDPQPAMLSRCSRCNGELRKTDRDAVRRRVPPFVYASQNDFAACDRCGHIYWRATHPERIMRELDAILSFSPGRGGLARPSPEG